MDGTEKGQRRFLTAAELLQKGKNKLIEIEIPELREEGDEVSPVVHVERLTAGTVIDFISDSEDKTTARESMLRLVHKSVRNPDGSPMFTSEEDVIALRDMRIDIFNRISDTLMKGLKRDEEAGKDASSEAQPGALLTH